MYHKLHIDKKNRQEVLAKLRADASTWDVFSRFDEKYQEDLILFCMGEQSLSITYDSIFKKLFDPLSDSKRLEWLISGILGHKIKILEVLQNHGTVIHEEASFVIMDVVVQLEDGTIMNVEMQKYGYLFPAQRTDCYMSDLLMRQYSDVRKRKGKDFRFQDISKVVVIVIMEHSPKVFHQAGDSYIHHGKMVYDTAIELDDLFFSTYVCLDVYKKICHTEINSMQEAWMRFLGSYDMKDVLDLCHQYPEFIPLYQEVFEFRQNVKGLVHMFSEALSVMTKNTERYMVEQLQKKVELQEEALEQNKAALEQKDVMLEQNKAELEHNKAALEQKDAELDLKNKRILELERLLANANSDR